jgi:hypothetical protein
MQVIAVSGYAQMTAFGRVLKTSCIVKTRTAKMSPAYPENQFGVDGPSPYQPKQFPKGMWPVTGVWPTQHELMAPVFIATGAHQTVTMLNGDIFEDYGYGIHFDAKYEETWGCFHLYSADDAHWLGAEILAAGVHNCFVQVL